ncbi:MAG TPA: tripartite tricarboxylate transporter substrate-binding protein, partial [Lautropia sp.]|nr:tripartite tricarboxylate transporter substrate-binding protein [Lautropia sp.]
SQVIMNGTTATLPFVTAKQLVGLAVTGERRLDTLPDAPTFKEAGLPAEDAGTWQGVLTTAGSPPALIERLNEELRKILAQPEVQQKIAEQGGVVKIGAPSDLGEWLTRNTTAWSTVIKEAAIKLE